MNLLERIMNMGEYSEQELTQGALAVLFASGEPIAISKIAAALGIDEEFCKDIIELLTEKLETQNSAFNILRLSGSYQLVTRKSYNHFVQKLFAQNKNAPPTQAGLEVLAIVAYNQPVTRNFIEQVRGVECGSVIGGLVEKGLLEEAGRLELPGRPISYKTTDNFLRAFGLSEISELPDLYVDKGD